MKKLLLALAVAAAFAAPTAAMAQAAPAAAPASPHTFTGNMTLASEYLYRGIAQTRGKPALQGGFDYSHSSGLYLGTWASSISWLSDATIGASSSLEMDVYGGYKGAISGDLGFDVGVLTYNYPGSGLPTGAGKPDTTEIYGALTYQWLSAKYSQTTGSLFGWTKTTGGGKTSGSGYLDVTGTWDLGSGFGLVAHVGHQTVKGRSSASYTDYKLGVTKDVGFGTVGLAYTSTDAKESCSAGEDYCFVNTSGSTYQAGKDRLSATFGKTF